MSELRIIAERIKKRIGVRAIASRFGFDYSDPGDRARYACPICRESSSSRKTTSVYTAEDGNERWHCFSCDVGGDCISWLAARLDCQPYESIRRLAGMLGVTVDDDALLGFLTESIGSPNSVARESSAMSSVRAVRAEWWRWRNQNPDAGRDDVIRRLAMIDVAETMARNGNDRVASFVREIISRPTASIPSPKDSRLSSAMRRAFRSYVSVLRGGDCYEFLEHEIVDPVEYCEGRRWSFDGSSPFQVGYCPCGFEDVNEIGSSLLEESGVIYRRRGKPYRHAMEGRVVFPIRSVSGRIVAFAGRTIVGDEAKYLNTRESSEFSKGSVLFGMYENLATIVAKRKVVVVEGYADVLSMREHRYGIAVAAMGTAITSDHAELLSRVADEVIVLLDGDKAGREAAERSRSVLRSTRYVLSVATLPPGIDPGDATLGQIRAALSSREPVDRPGRGPGVAWIERLLTRS